MTSIEIARQRLYNQRLAGTPCDTPQDAVRWLGAVQAQDYGAATWALAQRSWGVTNAAIDGLFNAGAILRTHVLRPTWHFVLPADIRWILQLTSPRVHALNAYYYRKLELDDAVFVRGTALMARALGGGRQLTRAELGRVLHDGGIEVSSLRLALLVMRAELDAVICSGALRGKQFTYALLEDRVPPTPPVERDEALAELTRRYFTSHGPATVGDYSWWSGLSASDARAGIDMVTPQLMHEIVDGKIYWFAAPTAGERETGPIVHLLPNFDEHLVAYKDHSASFEADTFQNQEPQSAMLLGYVVVINGHVIGGWRRTLQKNAVTITTSLLVSLTAPELAALQAAAQRYGQFMGMPVTLLSLPRGGEHERQ